jgi:hypothetical protein
VPGEIVVQEQEIFKEKIKRWSNEGYDTSGLSEMLDGTSDAKSLTEKFEEFERDVRSLKALEEALLDLDVTGFEDENETIKAKLRDPSKIPDIEDDIYRLQLKIERRKKEERRREEDEKRWRRSYWSRLEEWRGMGYNVTKLEKIINEDINTLDVEFKAFEHDVYELQRCSEEINKLRGGGFDHELDEISELLSEPDKIFQIEEELLKLKLRIDRMEKKRVVRKEIEEKARQRLREVMAEWRQRGLMVDRLEELIDGELDIATTEFEKVKREIGRLKVLQEELEEMDVKGFEDEAGKISKRMVDVDAVSEIEEEILHLQLKIEKDKKEARRRKEREERIRGELKEKILEWRQEGLVTDFLYSKVEGDLEELKRDVENFDKSVQRMKLLTDELKSLDTTGYEDEYMGIRDKLVDVRQVDEVEDNILALQVRIERERREKKRLGEIAEAVAAWEDNGYVVEPLRELISEGNMKALEREFINYKIGIHTLRELARDLAAIEKSGFEDKISEIRTMLGDIKFIPEIEERLFEIQRNIEERAEDERRAKAEESKEKHELVEKLTEWVSEDFRGGVLERLEQVIARDKDMVTVRTAFKVFESEVARVRELREVLDTLDATGFEAEVEEIRTSLGDIDRLDQVEQEMMALLRKIELKHEEEEKRKIETDQKRKEFWDQIKAWEEEGFIVDNLKDIMDEELSVMRRNFVVYRIRIQKLREIRKKIEEITDETFLPEVNDILPLLRDVEKISEVEEKTAGLDSKMTQADEDKRRKEDLVKKMEAYKQQGYNVERLERALEKEDINFISKEFLVFKIRMQKLEDLREELSVLALGAQDFEQDVAEIRIMLTDVEKISAIRERISALQAKIEERTAEEKRRIEEERAARNDLTRKITSWASQGYMVEDLEKVFDSDLSVVQETFREYEKGVDTLNILKEELSELETTGFEGDVALIENKFHDISKVREIEEDIAVLKERILRRKAEGKLRADEVKQETEELKAKIETWKEEGYDVSQLENLIGENLELARKEFVVFRVRAERLKAFEEDLKLLDTRGFEEEAERIRGNLKSVDKIDEIERAISDLTMAIQRQKAEIRAKREEEKRIREAYAEKLVQWIQDGFSVSTLEKVIGQDIDLIQTAFQNFEGRVHKLKDMVRIMDDLEKEGLGREIRELRTMITDVDNVEVIENRLEEILGNKPEISNRIAKEAEEGPPVSIESRAQDLLTSIRQRLGSLRIGHDIPEGEEEEEEAGEEVEKPSEEITDKKVKKKVKKKIAKVPSKKTKKVKKMKKSQ